MKFKKQICKLLVAAMAITSLLAFGGCGNVEKNITVVVREQGSGTREAFDTKVTDGVHLLQDKNANGEKVYYTTDAAVVLNKTGTVLSKVASDENAIGYISLGSVNDTIKVVSIDGVTPNEQTVLNGTYSIQRPFVVMTKNGIEMTALAADFMTYLMSNASKAHAEGAGCVYLADPQKRANEGASPIAVTTFEKQATLPAGEKIVVRGSTSMEKYITSAAKGYADVYGVDAENIFDIQLEGSSVGRKAVESDTVGNVIGLSSAAVDQPNINSFMPCLDAVALIVNTQNTAITNLTLKQVYDIFSGKIQKFSEVK